MASRRVREGFRARSSRSTPVESIESGQGIRNGFDLPLMRSIPARLFKAVAIFLVLATVPAFAQAPEPPPLPAAPATPTPALRALLDQIAACVESGKLNVEIDLQAGRV